MEPERLGTAFANVEVKQTWMARNSVLDTQSLAGVIALKLLRQKQAIRISATAMLLERPHTGLGRE